MIFIIFHDPYYKRSSSQIVVNNLQLHNTIIKCSFIIELLKKLKVTKQLFIRLTSYTKMRWLSLLLCLNVCSRQPSKKLNVQNPFIICNCTLIHLDMFTFLLNLLKPLNRADSALLTVTRSNSDFKPY